MSEHASRSSTRSTAMKRALTLLALLAITALAAVVLAQSAAVSLKPAQTTVYEGSTTTITVHVAPTGATVFAGNVTITYDAAGLEFVKAEPGDGIQFLPGFPKVEDGKVVIVFFTTQGISAEQDIASIQFRAKGEGEYKVKIVAAGLADDTGSDIPVTLEAAESTITVKPRPTYTAPPTIPAFTPTTITVTVTKTVTETLTYTTTTTSVVTTTEKVEVMTPMAYALAVIAAIVCLALGVIIGKKH